jgi:hypothetical protein
VTVKVDLNDELDVWELEKLSHAELQRLAAECDKMIEYRWQLAQDYVREMCFPWDPKLVDVYSSMMGKTMFPLLDNQRVLDEALELNECRARRVADRLMGKAV